MVNGVPQPPLWLLGTDKAPHLVEFSFCLLPLKVHNRLIGSNWARRASLTALSFGLFFKLFNHGRRTDSQYVCGISNASSLRCHVCNLLLHFWQIAPIGILPGECAARTLPIATLVPLFAFFRLTLFDHIFTATARAKNGFENPLKNQSLKTTPLLFHRSRTQPWG